MIKEAERIAARAHQASQTYFVLRHLLGYSHVLWYDAGWTEWSARSDLPVIKGAPSEARP